MSVGDAEVLGPAAVAAGVGAERRNRVVRLRIEHVAAVQAVLFAEPVVDAGDVLILVDWRRSARTPEVNQWFGGVRCGDKAVEKLAGIVAYAVLRDYIARKRLARLGVKEGDRSAREIPAAVGRRRNERRSTADYAGLIQLVTAG